MIEKIRKSEKLNYRIMSILIAFQICTAIWFSYILPFFSIYIHITNWSFIISTIYLILSFISDTNHYFFSVKKIEKLRYFVRNSFSKVAYPFCFMITIGFWGILLIGIIFDAETFTKNGAHISAFKIISNFHLHFGITIIMILDLIFNERREMKITFESLIINISIFAIYAAMVLIAKYIFNKNAYVFIGNIGFLPIIGVGVGIFGLLIGCILLFNTISNKLNKCEKNIKYNDFIKEEEMPDNDV